VILGKHKRRQSLNKYYHGLTHGENGVLSCSFLWNKEDTD